MSSIYLKRTICRSLEHVDHPAGQRRGAYNFIKSSLEVLLLSHLVVLAEQRVRVLREELRRPRRRRPGGVVLVDKLAARLVETHDEACLPAEASRDGLGIL